MFIIFCFPSSMQCRHFIYLTEDTKKTFENNVPQIESIEELKALLKEIKVEKADREGAISEVCGAFLANGIELPKWTRGHGQFIPLKINNSSEKTVLDGLMEKFERLKIEFTGAKCI